MIGGGALLLTLAGPGMPEPPPVPAPADIRDHLFVEVQRAQGSVAAQALAAAASRIAAGRPELALLLRERQDLAEDLRRTGDRLAAAVAGRGAAAEAGLRGIEQDLEHIRARLAELDAALAEGFPAFRDLMDPAPLDRASLQALLDADEALLLVLSEPEDTWVWAVSPGAAGWHRAGIDAAELAQRVRALRDGLGDSAEARAARAMAGPVARGPAFDRGAAHALYLALLGPLEPVFAGAAHVMVVPDGPLTALPFGMLVTTPPEGGDDDPAALRDTGWMIARHALTTLPGVPALRALRHPQPAPDRPEDAPLFVGFGNPVLGLMQGSADGGMEMAAAAQAADGAGFVTRGVYEDIRRVADLAPLPHTARELRALARVMGHDRSVLYLGAAATEAAVKAADLRHAEVVAFATHGLLRGGLPGLSEPALVLTPPTTPDAMDDALLTATEAAALSLSASLVILSACDTAGSDGTPGAEGLSGLARAFIHAGARAILVSHWPVDDRAASVLTVRMLEAMRTRGDHRTRAEALRLSMLALMADPAVPRHAHPSFWAPFVVVGEGGRDRRGPALRQGQGGGGGPRIPGVPGAE